jgi:hypothetical protein
MIARIAFLVACVTAASNYAVLVNRHENGLWLDGLDGWHKLEWL